MSEATTQGDHDIAPPEAWDAIAAGYDEFIAPGEAEFATEALQRAGLTRGDRFLDVAAGPGGLSLPAARLGAMVLATDWSPAMIERFEARVQSEGLSGAQGRVMDAHDLDLPDDTFDVSGSQFGVMLLPDQPRAIAELVRVTKPGGRVLVIAYGSPAEVEFLQFFVAALKAVQPDFPGLPDNPPPLEFQVADPAVLRDRLETAGLREVVVHTDLCERLTFATGGDMWNWVINSNPIAGALTSDLDGTARATLIDVLDGLLRERSSGNGAAELTAPLNVGIGTV